MLSRILALIMLVVLSPLFLLVIVLITIDDGFPVFFDTELSHSGAARVVSYIKHSKFLDGATSKLMLHFITYNRQVRIFTNVRVSFELVGGNIKPGVSIDALSLEKLVTTKDKIYFGFEVLVWMLVFVVMVLEAGDFLRTTQILQGHFQPMHYFR